MAANEKKWPPENLFSPQRPGSKSDPLNQLKTKVDRNAIATTAILNGWTLETIDEYFKNRTETQTAGIEEFKRIFNIEIEKINSIDSNFSDALKNYYQTHESTAFSYNQREMMIAPPNEVSYPQFINLNPNAVNNALNNPVSQIASNEVKKVLFSKIKEAGAEKLAELGIKIGGETVVATAAEGTLAAGTGAATGGVSLLIMAALKAWKFVSKKILSSLKNLASKLGIEIRNKQEAFLALIGLIVAGVGATIGAPLVIGAGVVVTGSAIAIGGAGALLGGVSAFFTLLFGSAISYIIRAAISFVIFFFSFAALTAAILFIINSGAYLVPPGDGISGNGPGSNSSSTYVGSCPLTGSVKISVPAYDAAKDRAGEEMWFAGHGSNDYWGNPSSCPGNAWPMPIYAMYPPLCLGPSPDTPNYYSGNACANVDNSCPYYGYATDVVRNGGPSIGAEVIVPTLCDNSAGSCGSMTWTMTNAFINCGGASIPIGEYCAPSQDRGQGLIFTSEDNGANWKIYLNHVKSIQTVPAIGSTYTSGSVVATVYDQEANSHLHIEISKDGIPQNPDYLCKNGGSQPITTSTRTYGGDLNTGVADVYGYVAITPISSSAVVASTPSEYGSIHTCDWRAAHNLFAAVNANFYSVASQPYGPAGYNGQFTNNSTSSLVSRFESFTLVGNTGSIKSSNTLPDNLSSVPNLIAAVSGVTYDSVFPEESYRRTALGVGNGNLYLLATSNRTNRDQIKAVMESLGATQSFIMDSDISTQFCSSSSEVNEIRTERVVSVNIGVTGGTIWHIMP